MKQDSTYDHTLRAIGQALERHRLVSFSLKTEGDRYVVQGEAQKASGLLAWLRRQKPFGQRNFGPRDIEQLEQVGRAQRKAADQLPDFHSVSNILRAVGAYLEMQGGRLLELSKSAGVVMILFQNKQGHPQIEERTTAFLSDLAVRMYQKRQKNAGA
jgi:hypothetical protein